MSKEHFKELNKIIEKAIAEGAYPGATYAVVINDKVYIDSLGLKAKYPVPEENDKNTIYDLASLSKVISTTTCIMQLLEKGEFRLNTQVSSILPRFKHQDITIFDLMTHTSGMKEGISAPTTLKSKEEALDKMYSYDLVYPVHTKISYSDLNYILLGEIVEAVTKMPLNEYAKKYVFAPLEMHDTGYCLKEYSEVARIAPTEERNDDAYRGMVRGDVHDEVSYIMGGVAGHAGVFSTALDLSHFIKMILNEGEYNGKRILSKATVNTLFQVQVEEKLGVLRINERRGLGWIIRGRASSAGDLTSLDDTILHTGFTGTNIWIDRKNKVGFCLLTNRVHPKRGNGLHIEYRPRIANYIMAHLEELEKEIN